MTYYRLRDIKTPPFAYVTNKDEVIDTCPRCQMPFSEPGDALEVEIFTTEAESWETRIKGRPLMADLWLIGDDVFAGLINKHFPDMFKKKAVTIVSWMTRNPGVLAMSPADTLHEKEHSGKPKYYRFTPKHSIELDSGLRDHFPPISCNTCRREFPEIPIEYQRIPDTKGTQPQVASLAGFYLEGYDYLFHESCTELLSELFPEMLLEQLVSEPLTI